MRDEHYMLRRSKMRNPRILQMAVLAYAYSRFVPKEKAGGTPERLLALADRSKPHGDWYASNTVITSSHDFIARVFEAWLGSPLFPAARVSPFTINACAPKYPRD